MWCDVGWSRVKSRWSLVPILTIFSLSLIYDRPESFLTRTSPWLWTSCQNLLNHSANVMKIKLVSLPPWPAPLPTSEPKRLSVSWGHYASGQRISGWGIQSIPHPKTIGISSTFLQSTFWALNIDKPKPPLSSQFGLAKSVDIGDCSSPPWPFWRVPVAWEGGESRGES